MPPISELLCPNSCGLSESSLYQESGTSLRSSSLGGSRDGASASLDERCRCVDKRAEAVGSSASSTRHKLRRRKVRDAGRVARDRRAPLPLWPHRDHTEPPTQERERGARADGGGAPARRRAHERTQAPAALPRTSSSSSWTRQSNWGRQRTSRLPLVFQCLG